MKKNKKKKKLRLKKEIKRKIKIELIKTALIFIGGVAYGRYALNYSDEINKKELKIKFDDLKNKIVEVAKDSQEEIKQEEIKEDIVCNLDETSCLIYNKGQELGLTKEQSIISIAIAMQETGRYTSNLFKTNNNLNGMYCEASKSFYKYETIEEGIEKYINCLKNVYFNQGLNTIDKIQPKYAPIGAENDPNGLNKNRASNVKWFYNDLAKKIN